MDISGPTILQVVIVFLVLYLPVSLLILTIFPLIEITVWNVFWTAVILRGASALAILNATGGRAW